MNSFAALFELTRGRIVESIHFGAIAVVDSNGTLIHSHGDPHTVAFLRSSAKPFQALPFVERGGAEHFGFTQKELALARYLSLIALLNLKASAGTLTAADLEVIDGMLVVTQ